MGRIATNTKVQIKNLANRGMLLDYDEAKIKEFLLGIGYYRLGFYWNPFEKDEHRENLMFNKLFVAYYYYICDNNDNFY